MTVLKRGKRYWIDFSFSDRRIRKRSPENSYKGAQAYELLLRQKLARGEPLEKSKPETRYTFKEIALQWLTVNVRNNNKPSEYLNKKNILNGNLIPYFGTKFIDAISTQHIEQYKSYLLTERKLKEKSINNYLSILSCCLKSALESEILKAIPKIKLLKVPPQKYDYLTEAETELLLQHARGLWHDMILLAVRTGLRFGELIALQWDDINFKAKTLTVSRNLVRGIMGSPKNNRSRIIPLTPSVIEMLHARERISLYIFHNRKVNPLRYNDCRDSLHEACKRAEIRIINWHVLRHSFASHLAAKGVSIFSIKELLGHSDIRMTMRYSHVNLPILQDAIAVLEPAIKINGTIASQTLGRDSEFDFPLPINLQNSLGKIKKLDDNPVF